MNEGTKLRIDNRLKALWGLLALLSFVFMVVLGCLWVQVIRDAQIAREQAVRPNPVETQPVSVVADRVPGALRAVNTYRALHDLPALTLNGKLSNSAQAKADDLVQQRYWAHFRDGATPWSFITEAGYAYARAGENLGKCYPDADSLVQAWINSPTHEAVLLGDYAEVGFGITKNTEDGCNYVVGHFATELQDLTVTLPETGVAR
jgi:uncharacterized protein YkwD